MKKKLKLYFCLFISFLFIINNAYSFTINFNINSQMERHLIYTIFTIDDPAGLKSRAQSMGIPLKSAKKIQKAKSYDEVSSVIEKIVEPKYQKLNKEMNSVLNERKNYWDKNINEFSELVKSITGHDWFYPNYDYYVTAFQLGVSSWYENNIGARYDLKDDMDKRLFGHEILLSHAFHIMRKYFSKEVIDDWKVWAFSEITAVLIMEDKRLDHFWPEQVRRGNYFSNSNYPQIASLEDDLRKIFINRKDFIDYVNKSVPILQAFNNTHGNKPKPKKTYSSLKFDFSKDNNEWSKIKPVFDDGKDNLKKSQADIRKIYSEIDQNKLYILFTTQNQNNSVDNETTYGILVDINNDDLPDYQLAFNKESAWIWDLRKNGLDSYNDFNNLTRDIDHASFFGKTIKFMIPMEVVDNSQSVQIKLYTIHNHQESNHPKKWLKVK